MDYSREANLNSTPHANEEIPKKIVERVVDLDTTEPIDFVTPIQNLGGQK